jgi:thioredoxin reductase (NADPH)
LTQSGTFTGLRVIGSRYSQDTFRVREFLAKNRVPYSWLDLEADPKVKQLLQQFRVSEADTPVVAWGHKVILRNPWNRELAEALGLRRPLERTAQLLFMNLGPWMSGTMYLVQGGPVLLAGIALHCTALHSSRSTSPRDALAPARH